MKFDQDLCGTRDMNSILGSVVPLAMFLHNFHRENIEYRPLTFMHSHSCLQQFQGFEGLFFFSVNSDILILGSVLEGLDKPFV